MRWVVGDVQGCARELHDLLAWIRFDSDRDELWCLGDLVNRGPDSLAALRLWRDVDGRGLLGNHDIYALLAHTGSRPRKGDTLEPLYRAADGESLLARLREQPVLACLAGDAEVPAAWIVHAGLHPHWDDLHELARRLEETPHDDGWLVRPEVKFATRVRCCTGDGQRCPFPGAPDACPPPHRAWDEFYRGPTRVVHGHWARRGAYRGPRTMGLDAGCVYGGALTAWCQEEDRIVQVPSRQVGGSPREFPARQLPAWSPGPEIR